MAGQDYPPPESLRKELLAQVTGCCDIDFGAF